MKQKVTRLISFQCCYNLVVTSLKTSLIEEIPSTHYGLATITNVGRVIRFDFPITDFAISNLYHFISIDSR